MYHKIINGETIAEMQKMPAESVDLIFADPPYWILDENGRRFKTRGRHRL